MVNYSYISWIFLVFAVIVALEPYLTSCLFSTISISDKTDTAASPSSGFTSSFIGDIQNCPYAEYLVDMEEKVAPSVLNAEAADSKISNNIEIDLAGLPASHLLALQEFMEKNPEADLGTAYRTMLKEMEDDCPHLQTQKLHQQQEKA